MWKSRLPPAWLYDPLPADPAASSLNLLAALTAASEPAAAQWLAANKVDTSWEGATSELLAQYDRAIEANMPHRREKSSNKARAWIAHCRHARGRAAGRRRACASFRACPPPAAAAAASRGCPPPTHRGAPAGCVY